MDNNFESSRHSDFVIKLHSELSDPWFPPYCRLSEVRSRRHRHPDEESFSNKVFHFFLLNGYRQEV